MTAQVSDRLREALERLDQAIDRLDACIAIALERTKSDAPASDALSHAGAAPEGSDPDGLNPKRLNAALAERLDRIIERVETALTDKQTPVE